MKIHNFFYFNLFQKILIDLSTNQVYKLPLFIVINNRKKWEAEIILKAKSH